MKGIYKLPSGRYQVKKYGCHIGVYDTYEEAELSAKEAEQFHLLDMGV